jgi:ribosomal protein S20
VSDCSRRWRQNENEEERNNAALGNVKTIVKKEGKDKHNKKHRLEIDKNKAIN